MVEKSKDGRTPHLLHLYALGEVVLFTVVSIRGRSMKKKIIKSFVMLVLFFGAVITFAVTLNQDIQDLTMAMEKASLPVVYFTEQNATINELHGYVKPMNLVSMRDSITPVAQDRLLHLKVMTYDADLEHVRYEIRSMDGQRLVAKNDITDFSKTKDVIFADLEIQNVLEENAEYTLQFILTVGGEDVYYYTRLIQTSSYYVKECLDFALQFHDYTFRSDAGDFIPTYMDAATGDATTLDYVDLSCTLKQITWADFIGEKITEPVVSIKEINASYNVLTLQYVLSSRSESGEIEYYNVEEYYRLRYTTTRMYVLNFERRMNQVFRGENNIITDGHAIQLGIRNRQIEYAISETGDVIAFVQEGELWCFDRVGEKIVRVFSFLDAEGIDPREIWDQHDIRIVRVDEAGSIDFVVYGYMNRGIHEGQVGTGVYHYDGLVHTVEEEIFIPSLESYEILKAEMGQLMYVNEKGDLYLMIDSDVYAVNLDTYEVRNPVTNLKNSCYVVSSSNRYFAWVDSARENTSTQISMMDLSDGSTHHIEETKEVYLRPLGFIDEDFIYGAADKEEVKADTAGNTIFPMGYLKIMGTADENFSVLKRYEPKEKRISSIEVQDYTIQVNLLESLNGRYVEAGSDSIMNQVADTKDKVTIRKTVTEIKETQRQIAMKEAVDGRKIKLITSKLIVQEEAKEIELASKDKKERFFVYVKGDVVLATDGIAEAIQCANEKLGVVIDSRQQYIWMRARKNAQNPFKDLKVNDLDKEENTVVQAISAILHYKGVGLSVKERLAGGETPKSIMEKTIKDGMVLDVSGCTVDEIIFYVSDGSPVFAMTGEDSAVLVTGYTSSVIYYFEPQSGATKTMSYIQADELFKNAGNVFFTYLND